MFLQEKYMLLIKCDQTFRNYNFTSIHKANKKNYHLNSLFSLSTVFLIFGTQKLLNKCKK